ncbi:FAD/NAD-binding domain-containing protein [Mycena metata]|uniref:FAD/NAD-binding domain-containing protein n=1 Tax=Mycena metata TaxID=1033252 RepID=A0AAD7J598_9AGAR|nr:FAD/NAD-binding domain-containing protein [Mycena metata]
MNVQPAPRAIVVGAGPVGCLSAMALAKLGWHVTVYERRSDLRATSLQLLHSNTKSHPRQRSINLTLSSRGIAAVQAVDSSILDRLMSHAVPLQGRMVHCSDGTVARQQYDRAGHCLYSIERGLLNLLLLEAACFEFEEHFDLCIGADGSHSVIRRDLMQATQMEYSQHYLSHDYVEIRLPHGMDRSGNHTFLLDPDHLHVWPRGDFTMIFLPWFKSYFPDLCSLFDEKRLVQDFQNNPRSDAAHSMVPFYGQGLNCALEDVRVLSILLQREKDGHNPTVITRVLDEYSRTRHADLIAICDLAMESHLKLRHDVATWTYMIKAFIDNILYAISKTGSLVDLSQTISGPEVPSGWIPLYSMVSFRPDISYSAAKKKAEHQERLIDSIGLGLGALSIGYAAWFLFSFVNNA